MTLSRKEKHVETLVGADKGIDDTYRIGRMHIVVNVSGAEQEMPFQVLRELLVGLDMIYECRVALLDFSP